MTRSFYALLLVLWLLLLYAVVSGPLTARAAKGLEPSLAAPIGTAVLPLHHAATSAGTEASLALTWAEAESVICFDGAAWDCDTALLIAFRESRFVPDAYNPGCRCVGLFQIAGIHGHTYDVLVDPYENTRIAHELYLGQGWRPWRTQ